MFDAIRALGVWAILVFAALDSVGLPASGDAAVVLAAATGEHPLLAIVALGFAGAVLGDQVVYTAGRAGRRLVPARIVTAERSRRASEALDRRAPLALVGGRLITAVRSEIAFLAGVARVPYRRFALWNALGCLLWAVLASLAGRLLGRVVDMREVLDRAERWSTLLTVAIVAGLAAYAAYALLRRR